MKPPYAINVVIPLAGRGARFTAAGYFTPKPLIRARGRSMVSRCIAALRLTAEDTLVLVYHCTLDQYSFRDVVRQEFPELQVRFVSLGSVTRGAAETVLQGLVTLSSTELERSTLVVDGDSIFTDDIVGPMRRSTSSVIFYYEDHECGPIYSFISLDDGSRVVDIREKEKISPNACIGAYGFESGTLLHQYCERTIEFERRSNNEYYMSSVYRTMLDDGVVILGREVDHWACLGTPVQLRTWAEQRPVSEPPLRICFSLDNTLVSNPAVPGDYETCAPFDRNIRFLRALKEEGHCIIIYVDRGMNVHDTWVAEDVAEQTRLQLERFGIPFDELIFGKPHAHMYVDDRAVIPQAGLERQTGFYMDSGLEPRSWHSLTWFEKTVRKTGPVRNVEREIAWYRNLPPSLSDIAPKLISWGEGELEIERVSGIPMSQLHVSGALRIEHLDSLLRTLHRLHTYPVEEGVELYANYAAKIESRDAKFDSTRLPGYGRVRDKVVQWAQEYEKRDLGQVGLIHGDPVLTNVIVTPLHDIKLIDPRGTLGAVLTLAGDVFYDYAKVYQSLIGYDAVLQNLPQPENDALVDFFERHLHDKFGAPALLNVTMMTASMFCSLIPLHQEALRAGFLQLAEAAISLAERR